MNLSHDDSRMTDAGSADGVVISGPTVTGWAQGGSGIAEGEMARRAGLRGRIVSNLFHFAQVTELLLSYFGDDWLSDGEIHLTYHAPLNDGENLTPKARLVNVIGQTPRTTLSVWCENDLGEVLASGEASCTRHDTGGVG